VSLTLQEQRTPMFAAAEEGHTAVVAMLLAHSANVNQVIAVSYFKIHY